MSTLQPALGLDLPPLPGSLGWDAPPLLARELIGWLEELTVTQGEGAGRPLSLMPYQRRFIRGAFAPGVSSAGLSMGRGGGKSTLAGGLGAATLDHPPMMRHAGEAVIVASSLDQARRAGRHAVRFLRSRPGVDLDDRRIWRVTDHAQRLEIEHRPSGSVLKCISSDYRRAHGLAPSIAILDEPAQWAPSTGERLLAALETSLGKVDGSRLIIIGTRPASPEHWWEQLLEDGLDYSQVHAARPSDPPWQRRTWERANPAIRFMPALLAAYRREAARARRDAARRAAFEALRLNLGVPEAIGGVPLLDAGEWERAEGDVPRCEWREPIWGLDLGTSAAMSAVACQWASGRLEAMAAFPATPDLGSRGDRDGVGSRYLRLQERGELITAGERAVDLSELLAEALARWGQPSTIVADRWRQDEAMDAARAAGVFPDSWVPRGMGWRDGAEDVRRAQHALLGGRVTPVRSLLLRGAIAEVRLISDAAGNHKIAQGAEGGRRSRARDDAAVAAVLAMAEAERYRGEGVWPHPAEVLAAA